jgi:hypothetical protein
MALLTLYNVVEASGNPTSLPQIAGGSTFVLPGGAGVQNTGQVSTPFVGAPKLEAAEREVLDATSITGIPTPAPTGSLLAWNWTLTANNGGGALWTTPVFAGSQAAFYESQFGIVIKPGSPLVIDDLPLGSGVGALVVYEGPVNALCVAPTAGGAIVPGTILTSDGTGNLQPFQPPSAAPTPTVTNGGTAGSTSYSYRLVAISVNGTYSALGTAGTTATGNATLSATNYNVITWTPVADAAGYLIVRSAGGAAQGTIGAVGIGTNTFIDFGQGVQTGTTATQPYGLPVTPGAPTVTTVGTAGTTTYTYTIAAIAPNGLWSPAGTAGSTTTGNATLSTTNYNKLVWTATVGASSYAIQRTVGGATQGFIGYASLAQATAGFFDYGITATTYTQNLLPTPTPAEGTGLARAIGSLAAGTTTPTPTAVFVGQS